MESRVRLRIEGEKIRWIGGIEYDTDAPIQPKIEYSRTSVIRINWDRAPFGYAIVPITENRMRSMQYMKPDTVRIFKIITCGKRA
ncbi:hypothetical protein TNCV_802711 [Trichonephila clavipes]|nr:hypothetical protein TNCV_802711 [Trichonephila clavipes]